MVGGLLVGVTSVGSGSLIMVCLILLYPALSSRRLVGTDLVQAVPPTWVGVTGVAAVLGPLAWAAVRRAHGRPAFDRIRARGSAHDQATQDDGPGRLERPHVGPRVRR